MIACWMAMRSKRLKARSTPVGVDEVIDGIRVQYSMASQKLSLSSPRAWDKNGSMIMPPSTAMTPLAISSPKEKATTSRKRPVFWCSSAGVPNCTTNCQVWNLMKSLTALV